MKFKREIFLDGGDMTYRVRYSRKGDQIIYWLRILETFHPDLGHFLRWRFDSDIHQRLFQKLDQTNPELADEIFIGLAPCAHCYGGNCMARVRLEWKGNTKEACREVGWNKIGFEQANYENLWIVLNTLIQLV
jgi:hypothetical protein